MTKVGAVPAATVPIAVRAPVVASTEYEDTLFEPLFATYKNLPSGESVIHSGNCPAATVPEALSAPVAGSRVKMETSLELVFAV